MPYSLIAQTVDRHVTAASGTEFSTSQGSVAFTIGEPLTETTSGGNAIFTQGFHQGTINISSIREQISDAEISVYPNPTSNFLNIRIEASGEWMLHAVDGKLVKSGQLDFGYTEIDLNEVALATYTLTLVLDDKRSNTYRIVKTQ